MTHITTCPRCGDAYEERSEEAASRPDRCCPQCWSAEARKYQERVPAPAKHVKNMCRSCGRELVFLRTRSGSWMPCNAETVEPGDELFDAKRHISHFSDCPGAADHRRKA